MAVYPFYVDIDSSSRRTMCGCGTKSKEGYMTTKVYQRDEGCITQPFEIKQSSDYVDGVLMLHTRVFHNGEMIADHATKY